MSMAHSKLFKDSWLSYKSVSYCFVGCKSKYSGKLKTWIGGKQDFKLLKAYSKPFLWSYFIEWFLRWNWNHKRKTDMFNLGNNEKL